jgi:hypothetical protein
LENVLWEILGHVLAIIGALAPVIIVMLSIAVAFVEAVIFALLYDKITGSYKGGEFILPCAFTLIFVNTGIGLYLISLF